VGISRPFACVGLHMAAFPPSPPAPTADEYARQLEQSQQALDRQASLFRSVLESISDGVSVADPTGRLLHFNAAAEKILGLGLTTARVAEWSSRYGCFLPDMVTPYPPQELPLARAIRGETVTDGEIFIRNPNRPQGVWLSVNASPLLDAEGQIAGGVAVFRDITTRKRLDAALQTTAEELARSNQDLQQFAYVVSHDLQQPLRKIARFCRLVEDEGKDRLDGQARSYLGYAIDAAGRMSHLIQELLTYARVGRGGLRTVAVDLSEIFREALADLPDAAETGAAVTIDTLPVVTGDPTQLGQLAANLLGNALKYHTGRPQVRVTAERRDGAVQVTVRDNGIGISAESLERLFGEFERGAAALAQPGTGLGLAICKRIVENHGGRIWAESQPGQGTAVMFTLPGSPGEMP
jgi:PAS domain S-box-containing protein